ncbi:MAG: endoribonuclease [Bacillales bacterium]|jgi:2-iminobutanoate/2-iminopropanoate deaminase|nr:endoribonuclease [Bacillales bacterium]
MKIVSTTNAPSAIGPYSQAVQVGDFLFCSGQIALDKNGSLVDGGIAQQTHQIFHNIEAILTEANLTLENVAKTTVFLSNMNNFVEVNEIYSNYFKDHKPARSCVEVSRLPKDVLIEIEIIAYNNTNK